MVEAKATKERVNYRKAKPSAERRCGNCWMFVPKNYACTAVAGLIDKNDVCDWWERKRTPAAIAAGPKEGK